MAFGGRRFTVDGVEWWVSHPTGADLPKHKGASSSVRRRLHIFCPQTREHYFVEYGNDLPSPAQLVSMSNGEFQETILARAKLEDDRPRLRLLS